MAAVAALIGVGFVILLTFVKAKTIVFSVSYNL
jgi:hypothetical protein